MDTARLQTQLPIIMGLSSSALILILILSISTPLTTLCLPSPYSLPAIKSLCVEYVCSMWSLLSSRANHSQEHILITPRKLFLLVNFIILFLLISLHLQQHPPAARKRSSRKKRPQRTEKLIMNDEQAAPLQTLQDSSLAHDLTGSAAAAMAQEAFTSSECAAESLSENLHTEPAAPMQVNDRGLAQDSPTVDADRINASDVEQIVLEEDGRLRLISGPVSPTVGYGDTKGLDAEKTESGRLGLIEPTNGSDGEKIVLEEDGQLRLIESTNGSDAEKVVLEADGRLRLIDKPLPSSRFRSSKPQKSLSTGDNKHHINVDNDDHNFIYDTQSLNSVNYDSNSLNNSLNSVNYDSNSLNKNENLTLNDHNDSLINHDYSNQLNELNNGTLTIDLSSDASLNDNLNHDLSSNASLNDNLNHDDAHNLESSSLVRTSSRPMRVKKSDSMDATWKAINNNRGSAVPSGNRNNNKHLIRQSSRQDFKPSRGGGNGQLMRASNNNNNNIKVRREPSISQDELNAKVESFIAKFNEQIRIQRQQSILSYMQMVDRGA